jgi:hypothetical protein
MIEIRSTTALSLNIVCIDACWQQTIVVVIFIRRRIAQNRIGTYCSWCTHKWTWCTRSTFIANKWRCLLSVSSSSNLVLTIDSTSLSVDSEFIQLASTMCVMSTWLHFIDQFESSAVHMLIDLILFTSYHSWIKHSSSLFCQVAILMNNVRWFSMFFFLLLFLSLAFEQWRNWNNSRSSNNNKSNQ